MAALGVDIQHTTVAHRESHLVGRDLRTGTPHEEEPLQVCTPPAKWPGQLYTIFSSRNMMRCKVLFVFHFFFRILRKLTKKNHKLFSLFFFLLGKKKI